MGKLNAIFVVIDTTDFDVAATLADALEELHRLTGSGAALIDVSDALRDAGKILPLVRSILKGHPISPPKQTRGSV